MKLFTSPQNFTDDERYLSASAPVVFLAGSIEQGTAVNWQDKIIAALREDDCILLNPRRENWDASWEQSINNEKFKEQVLWELTGIDTADIVLIYFDPATKSPISLLEMGLVAADVNKEVLVFCPQGFYRKGNVDIVAEKYSIDVFEDEALLIAALKKIVNR